MQDQDYCSAIIHLAVFVVTTNYTSLVLLLYLTVYTQDESISYAG